jgi:hypothetical protein
MAMLMRADEIGIIWNLFPNVMNIIMLLLMLIPPSPECYSINITIKGIYHNKRVLFKHTVNCPFITISLVMDAKAVYTLNMCTYTRRSYDVQFDLYDVVRWQVWCLANKCHEVHSQRCSAGFVDK